MKAKNYSYSDIFVFFWVPWLVHIFQNTIGIPNIIFHHLTSLHSVGYEQRIMSLTELCRYWCAIVVVQPMFVIGCDFAAEFNCFY